MKQKVELPILAKSGSKRVNHPTIKHGGVTASAGALAIKMLEENRRKGIVIEIPSIGLTINGTK